MCGILAVIGKKDIEVMFTNSQMNEVYYYFFDGNFP